MAAAIWREGYGELTDFFRYWQTLQGSDPVTDVVITYASGHTHHLQMLAPTPVPVPVAPVPTVEPAMPATEDVILPMAAPEASSSSSGKPPKPPLEGVIIDVLRSAGQPLTGTQIATSVMERHPGLWQQGSITNRCSRMAKLGLLVRVGKGYILPSDVALSHAIAQMPTGGDE